MTTIGRTNFLDNGSTAQLIAAPLIPVQVTLMADGPIFLGASAGLSPTADRAHLIYLGFFTGIPLQLNLATGDALYAVPYPGNGPTDVDWVIT